METKEDIKKRFRDQDIERKIYDLQDELEKFRKRIRIGNKFASERIFSFIDDLEEIRQELFQ